MARRNSHCSTVASLACAHKVQTMSALSTAGLLARTHSVPSMSARKPSASKLWHTFHDMHPSTR
eukprot:1158376-Pelagomonas_calceolata.AAC.18